MTNRAWNLHTNRLSYSVSSLNHRTERPSGADNVAKPDAEVKYSGRKVTVNLKSGK